MRPLGRGREVAPGTTVLEHLHRSAALDVYDAWNEPRACRVVVKTPRPDKLKQANTRRWLLREGRLLMRLSHPHIVRGYEVHDGPWPVVVMETLGGQTVEHLLQHTPKPLGGVELAIMGLHLAGALRHLHHHGVLHLDLKPNNLVAEAGRAKIIDLSHARKPGEVRAGHGTWCYIPPEQARGGVVGPPADVWGLGVVLYAVASRSNPLADLADELDVDEPALHGRVPPLRTHRPRLPRRLLAFVDACLEPEPDARPTIADAVRELDAISG